MKYETKVTEVKDVTVNICPHKVVYTLLSDLLRTLSVIKPHREFQYDNEYTRVSSCGIVIRVRIKEGYSSGHYDQPDKRYEDDITNQVAGDTLALLKAYRLVLDNLEEF
jgi:hypothetical protein